MLHHHLIKPLSCSACFVELTLCKSPQDHKIRRSDYLKPNANSPFFVTIEVVRTISIYMYHEHTRVLSNDIFYLIPKHT